MLDLEGNKTEIMYIHLQKRKMYNWEHINENSDSFYIFRNEFVDGKTNKIYEMLKTFDVHKQELFDKEYKRKRKQQIKENILSGALLYRFKNFEKH